jgi:Glycosyl hydrolases family 43
MQPAARFAARVRRSSVLVIAVACIALVVTAAWTDVDAHARTRNEQSALKTATHRLLALRSEVARATATKGSSTATRDELDAYIEVTLGQLWNTNTTLNQAKLAAYLQGVDVDTLEACLGGIQNALGAIRAGNSARATADISAVSSPCDQLEGGVSSGLVYPFDFADPDVIRVGSTYFAYATNSVGGNIQIIESTNLTHWTAVGSALPQLPSWANPDYTWAPSVAYIGGKYDLYYAVDPTGSPSECISVATSGSPQGPFVDSSKTPLECQPSLGGAIDPDGFVDASGASYLLWKTGATGSSKIWAQQLDPSGTTFAAGSNPAAVLAPDQSWEGGNVEAPDMVEANGRYLLFFSGNDWSSANYAVGVATCAGPVGPCGDASAGPILTSGGGMAGPGSESVFPDASGDMWMAFDAWSPGAVGGSNGRGFYVRSVNLSGVPSVADPP